MAASYYVVKYVKDLVRDEPINVGIIIQSKERIVSKFIDILPDIDPQYAVFKSMLERLKSDIIDGNIDEIIWKHENSEQGSQIRFTEARATLATDLDFELDELFKRFVY